MTPVLGMGLRVELVEGVGPVVEHPIRTMADVEALRVPDPEEAFAPVLEAVRLVRAELPDGEGRDRLLRWPVHGRRVSRRGTAEPRALADEGDDAGRAGAVGRADGQAERDLRAVRRRQGRGGCRRDPALRLVGRHPLAEPLSGARRAVERQDPRRARRSDDPLRHRCLASPRGDRRRPAATSSVSTGASVSTTAGRGSPTARSRATSTPRRCSRRGTSSSARRATCSRARPGVRATSSTSVMACCPRRMPDQLTRLVALVREVGCRMRPAVVLMAYGSPDRLADVPAYYADIRGGRPIRPELLDDLVARYRALGIDDSAEPSPLNVVTEAARAALETELGISVSTGMRHWAPRIAEAVETELDGGRGLARRAGARASLLVALDREVRGALRRGRRRAGADEVRPLVGNGARLRRAARRADRRDDRPRRSSPRTRCPSGSSPRVTPTATSCSRPRSSSRLPPESTAWSFSFQSESATGEPWLGPDILDHLGALHEQGVEDVLVCPVGLCLRPSRDQVGHRRRGSRSRRASSG